MAWSYFSSLGGKAAQPTSSSSSENEKLSLSVKSLKVDQARLTLVKPAVKPQVLDNVNIVVNDFVPGAEFPFSVSAFVPMSTLD